MSLDLIMNIDGGVKDAGEAEVTIVESLVEAVEIGNVLRVQSLLEAGADPNKVNNRGVTALGVTALGVTALISACVLVMSCAWGH